MRFDVAVVGGGVIGLGIAYETQRRGLRTVVVTCRRAGAATGASAGMLAPVSEAEVALAPLTRAGLQSRDLYPDLIGALESIAEVDCDYRTRGALVVALHRDHASELEHLGAAHRRLSLETQWLERDEVLALEPRLNPRLLGALHVRHDRSVDPRKLCSALEVALCRLGGTLLEGRLDTLVFEGDRATGLSVRRGAEAQRLAASAVVLSTGAWWAASDLPPLPLRPVKGQVLHLEGEHLVEHVVRTPDVYVVPRAGGTLWVGASTEEAGFDASHSAGVVLDLLTAAWRVLPGVRELAFVETLTGFRPALRDHLPAIGPFGVQGLFTATGHYRNGVLLMPLTARWIADLIETGHVPEDLRPFLPDRFAAPRSEA